MGFFKEIVEPLLQPVDQSLLTGVRAEVVRRAESVREPAPDAEQVLGRAGTPSRPREANRTA